MTWYLFSPLLCNFRRNIINFKAINLLPLIVWCKIFLSAIHLDPQCQEPKSFGMFACIKLVEIRSQASRQLRFSFPWPKIRTKITYSEENGMLLSRICLTLLLKSSSFLYSITSDSFNILRNECDTVLSAIE